MVQWALVELSKNQDMQTRLRDELAKFGPVDPTWDQLTDSLPYLDAIVHETLRVHPPAVEINRVVRIISQIARTFFAS